MLNFVKQWIVKSKPFQDILEMNRKLLKENKELHESQKDPRVLVEAIMDKGITWYDYHDLAPEDMAMYWKDAQSVLNSKAFQNEKRKLIAEWSQWALKEARDFESVRDMRMQVSALQLITDQLEGIEAPGKKISQEEIDQAI